MTDDALGLHWFDVTMQTPMRDIGWVWLVLALAVVFVVVAVRRLVREWSARDEDR